MCGVYYWKKLGVYIWKGNGMYLRLWKGFDGDVFMLFLVFVKKDLNMFCEEGWIEMVEIVGNIL